MMDKEHAAELKELYDKKEKKKTEKTMKTVERNMGDFMGDLGANVTDDYKKLHGIK